MEILKFHESVLKKRHTKSGFDNLIEDISLHIYSNLKNHYKMNDDERGDFFCTFYPKIPGLVKRYKNNGIPFDGYLKNSIRWNIKAYRSAESNNRSKQKASYKEPFYLESPEKDFTEIKKIPLNICEEARTVLRLYEKEDVLSDTIKQRILYIYLIEENYLVERLKKE